MVFIMTKEILTLEKFTEILSSDQFDTVKNIHLIEKKINEIEGSKSFFIVNLAKNCLGKVKSYFDVEYTHDIEIIEKFIENNSAVQDLVTVFKRYESHHLRNPDVIGPYIIELTEDEVIERKDVFHYRSSMLPNFKETATGFLKGEDSIFRKKINYINVIPKQSNGIFIKPNPKFIEKSRSNFFKMMYEVMNDPYIQVESDYDLFNEKKSLFYKNFIGPEKPYFLIEQEEAKESREYIQKHLLKEISAHLLINLNDKFISDDLTNNFDFENSWVRLFSLCSSLVIEKKYQGYIQKLSPEKEKNFETLIEVDQLKRYRAFNPYDNNNHSNSVQIPEVLKIVLINSYSEFNNHLNTQRPKSASSQNQSISSQLEALVRLKEMNHISDEEFLLAKKKILD